MIYYKILFIFILILKFFSFLLVFYLKSFYQCASLKIRNVRNSTHQSPQILYQTLMRTCVAGGHYARSGLDPITMLCVTSRSRALDPTSLATTIMRSPLAHR